MPHIVKCPRCGSEMTAIFNLKLCSACIDRALALQRVLAVVKPDSLNYDELNKLTDDERERLKREQEQAERT